MVYSSQHYRYSTVQLIGSLTFSSDKMNNTSGEHAYILSCDRAVRIRSCDCDATDRELSARTWWPGGVLDRYLKGHCQIQAGASGLWPWQARSSASETSALHHFRRAVETDRMHGGRPAGRPICMSVNHAPAVTSSWFSTHAINPSFLPPPDIYTSSFLPFLVVVGRL